MTKFVWRDGLGWVKPHEAPPLRRSARSELAAPMLIKDFDEAVFSHADGRYYTSKKHWRDHLKAHGKVEVGNEKPSPPKAEPVFTEEAIGEAYDQWQAGQRPDLKDKPPEHWEGDVQEVAADV